jgi:hypothetical protein
MDPVQSQRDGRMDDSKSALRRTTLGFDIT